ncbi:MAG: hypothetical protein GY827_09910 [Cytophagales bacterium]|nr:hypothetical protein [Cytophagales bacterium]
MKQNKLLLLVALLLSCYLSNAQAGYLGRKFLLKYNLHTNIALNNPTYSKLAGYGNDGWLEGLEYIAEEDRFGMNVINEIDLEYIYSRTSSVSGVIGFTRTSIEHQIADVVGTSNESDFSGYNSNLGETVYYKNLLNARDLPVKARSFSLGIKHTKYYKSYSGIAPLGLYGAWSFHLLRSTAEIKDLSTKLQEILETEETDYSLSNTTFAIGYELGRQQVYYDRFVLSLAVSFKYIYGAKLLARASEYYDYGSGPSFYNDDNGNYNEYDLQEEDPEYFTQESRLKRNMLGRLGLQQLFNIKLGVAYLIK